MPGLRHGSLPIWEADKSGNRQEAVQLQKLALPQTVRPASPLRRTTFHSAVLEQRTPCFMSWLW
jgi:hypothetical protein